MQTTGLQLRVHASILTRKSVCLMYPTHNAYWQLQQRPAEACLDQPDGPIVVDLHLHGFPAQRTEA